MARIFISYAREDFKPVKELHQRLEGAGFLPWMDKVDLIAGKRWRPAIEQAIRKTDFFVICLSNHSVKKRSFVQREIKMALDLWQEKLEDDIYLIPVLLEFVAPEEIPDKLREVGWVFLYEENGWDELLRALKHGMEQGAIDADPKRGREEKLHVLQEQLLREEQRKAEEWQEREAKAHEQETQQKAEAKAREEEEQRGAEAQQREANARQEEERRQREAKAREVEEQCKAEEQRQREAKARQEEENRKAEERRQREAKARQGEARQQAEQKRPAENARFLAGRPRNALLRRAGVVMASLLAAILVGWFLLQKLQPELQPTMEYAIVLRYSVEIKDEKTRATSFSLTSGKPFRLHFTPQTDGYLYLLAPDENQVMRIYLNAQPVKANSDFADEWFTPDPKSKQGNITAIFSSEPIPLLKSLPTNPGSELGDQHLKDLENLRKQAASSSPILRDFTNFTNFTNGNAPSVFVTAAKSGQPVVFDITPEGK